MRIFARICTAALTAAASLAVSTSHAENGSTSYDFLNIPTSSHAYALGGTGIAIIDDDISLADQNPALIGSEIEQQVALGYMLYMGSGNFASLRYGMAAGEHGAWAAGIRYLNYGKLTEYDQSGIEGGRFSPTDMVFEGTYSHDINSRWRGGINLNLIYSHYHIYSAFAIGVDLGVNYYDEEHDLSFSAVIKNAGGQVKRFHEAYNRLPFDVQLGYMQGIGHSPFSVAITATHLTRWNLPYYTYPKNEDTDLAVMKSTFISNFFRHLTFGLQYQPSDKFYAALAYDYKTATDMSTYSRNFFSGFSLGLGLKVRGFGFGVSYGMPYKTGSTLMLNINCSIAELMN
ncbi:MAG: type IX secretion system protein PorQ [Muribaculaceae bacterium]|nr:type IX secretion system protein PorQ [Muribaculaceae bacterium]